MAEIRCELILQKARDQTRKKLAQIAKLDKELQKTIVNYNTLTNKFLDQLQQKQNIQEHSCYLNDLIQKILKVQRQMDWFSDEKVRLANSLYCSVNSDCQQMSQVLQNCDQYQEFLKEYHSKVLHSQEEEEIEALFQECRDEEYLELCICQPLQKRNCESQDLMIMCEEENCQKKWYHLKCVGLLKPPTPQEHWICQSCKSVAKNKNGNG